MGLTDAIGNAWDNVVDAATNPGQVVNSIAHEAWEIPKNFVSNVSETVDAPRLMNAIKDGSPQEIFDWGKENANGGVLPLLIDGAFGTEVYDVTSSFSKNLGDTLIDDSVNGLAHLTGLAQGGLEKLHILPDMKQIDQVLPDLDLYEDPDFENASTAETIAGRVGQIAGYAVPFVGTAGALLKGGKAALGAYQEGHLLSSITDKGSDVVNAVKGSLPAWMKPGSRTTDDLGSVNQLGKVDANGMRILNSSETEQLYSQMKNTQGELQFAKPDLKPGDKKYYQVNADKVDMAEHPGGLRVGSTESPLRADGDIILNDGRVIPEGSLPNGVQISGDVIHTPPNGITLSNGTVLNDGLKLPENAQITGGQKVADGDWVITRETLVDGRPGYDVYTPHDEQFAARWKPVTDQPGQYSPRSVPTDMVYLPEGKYEIPTSWGTASGEGPAFLAKYGPDDYNIITLKDATETGYLDNPTNALSRQFIESLPS